MVARTTREIPTLAREACVFTAHHLPLPPTGVNHQYTQTVDGVKLSAASRAYRKDLAEEVDTLWLLLQHHHGGILAIAQQQKLDLSVTTQWHLPRRSLYTRDLDGIVKLPIDTVFRCLQLNDARIIMWHNAKDAARPGNEGWDITIMAQPKVTVPPPILTANQGPRWPDGGAA